MKSPHNLSVLLFLLFLQPVLIGGSLFAYTETANVQGAFQTEQMRTFHQFFETCKGSASSTATTLKSIKELVKMDLEDMDLEDLDLEELERLEHMNLENIRIFRKENLLHGVTISQLVSITSVYSALARVPLTLNAPSPSLGRRDILFEYSKEPVKVPFKILRSPVQEEPLVVEIFHELENSLPTRSSFISQVLLPQIRMGPPYGGLSLQEVARLPTNERIRTPDFIGWLYRLSHTRPELFKALDLTQYPAGLNLFHLPLRIHDHGTTVSQKDGSEKDQSRGKLLIARRQ